MTRLSLLGIVLLAAGLALLIFAPQTRSCVTDYDYTACETASLIAFNVMGVIVIAVGIGLAVFGLRATR